MDRNGKLLVISGPSGAGKGTVISRILERPGKNVSLSVSATTRSPREGEADGVHYFFLTEEDFLEKVKNGEFLEYAFVHGKYYGTPKKPVEAALRKGQDIILEIDVQGAMQVRENFNEGIYIFLLPPSLKELRKRLLLRGTESEQDLELRMEKAAAEIEYLDRYDYVVINDDLQSAVDEMTSILSAERCRVGSDAALIIRKYREEI